MRAEGNGGDDNAERRFQRVTRTIVHGLMSTVTIAAVMPVFETTEKNAAWWQPIDPTVYRDINNNSSSGNNDDRALGIEWPQAPQSRFVYWMCLMHQRFTNF